MVANAQIMKRVFYLFLCILMSLAFSYIFFIHLTKVLDLWQSKDFT
jgi:hypothetical protein